MENISVQFFRSFSIIYKNSDVLRQIGKSPKSISVLKYLIMNWDRAVPVMELIEYFWDEEGGTNPENALKTLISRLRKSLSDEFPELRNCIVSEQGTYQWKPNAHCVIDVFEFEKRCIRLLNSADEAERTEEKFFKAIDIYRGNIDAPFSSDEWLRGRGLYFQELYLKTVYLFVACLKDRGDYDTVIRVCRVALNIEAFDENLNLEMMYALKETQQNNAALVHYRHSTDMYYKYLGIDPSEKMLEFYKQLIKADLSVKDNLYVIRDKLVQDKPEGTAFVCDYSIFKDIYHLQIRNVERWNVQMFLVLVMVENLNQETEFNPFVLDRIMRDLLGILVASLRKGDVVTRYSPSQYAVLLQMAAQNDGEIVIDRIRKAFYENEVETYAKLIFQVGPIVAERSTNAKELPRSTR